MTAKRTILNRERRPMFDAETLALFAKLEHTRPRRRDDMEVRELHRRLHLDPPWLMGNSVLDRSCGPCHPPGYFSHDDWFRVRRVREQLLEAARAAFGEPGNAPTRHADAPSD